MNGGSSHSNYLIGMKICLCSWFSFLFCILPFGLAAEEDPYLSAISSEASKVESSGQPTVDLMGNEANEEAGGIDMQAFEEELKTSYQGSYTFYLKLPRHTREEVFQVYSDGASIEEVRKMIMQRFLHR
jgi:hypothetical protein